MKYFLFLLSSFFLFSCGNQKITSDFDYSFSRSGGYAPIYENFLINGNKGYYSIEKEGKKTTKEFSVTNTEIANLENVLTQNNFRLIEEDFKKVYDRVSVTIYVKKGKNTGRKSDVGFIMPKHQDRWNNVQEAFQQLLDAKLKTKS